MNEQILNKLVNELFKQYDQNKCQKFTTEDFENFMFREFPELQIIVAHGSAIVLNAKQLLP